MQTKQDRTRPSTAAAGGGKGILELSPSNDGPSIVIVTIEIDHGDSLVVWGWTTGGGQRIRSTSLQFLERKVSLSGEVNVESEQLTYLICPCCLMNILAGISVRLQTPLQYLYSSRLGLITKSHPICVRLTEIWWRLQVPSWDLFFLSTFSWQSYNLWYNKDELYGSVNSTHFLWRNLILFFPKLEDNLAYGPVMILTLFVSSLLISRKAVCM